MMLYLESQSVNPAYNLALEEFAFDVLAGDNGLCILWRNDNTVVVGKHQNTFAEVNGPAVEALGTTVVRRLSGGGAVFHDLGNLNYTFIVSDVGGMDFAHFCRPVVELLGTLGIAAEVSGRNDVMVDGAKCSGTAQYRRNGKVMHHGTLLFDSDLSVVSRVLTPSTGKLESKGLASVRSRVTNLRPYLAQDMDTMTFFAALREGLAKKLGFVAYHLSPEDEMQVLARKANRYDQRAWNYGISPPHTLTRACHFPGVGRVEALLEVRQGRVEAIRFQGDFFGEPAELEQALVGREFSPAMLENAPVHFIAKLTTNMLEELLFS